MGVILKFTFYFFFFLMPPWRCQLKLLGKMLRHVKKSHSTDLHGGVEGIFSVVIFFFFQATLQQYLPLYLQGRV